MIGHSPLGRKFIIFTRLCLHQIPRADIDLFAHRHVLKDAEAKVKAEAKEAEQRKIDAENEASVEFADEIQAADLYDAEKQAAELEKTWASEIPRGDLFIQVYES